MENPLKPFQTEALNHLRSERCHLICVSPTGSGKSLIFERQAQSPRTRMLLVSPLVALARQHAARLQAAGLSCVVGGLRAPRAADVWIFSPETAFPPFTSTKLHEMRTWRPNFLVVDECHCLWEWGRGFRPAFARVPELLQELKIRKSLWLTATLPAPARALLISRLPRPVVEMGSFGVPQGLSIFVLKTQWAERIQRFSSIVRAWVERPDGFGVVFVATRDMAERLVRLMAQGFSDLKVACYHAGLAHEEKVLIERSVAQKEIRVLVATTAFGMGMDYSHLNWVIFWQAPYSLLSLAQALGRVGRSQKPATAMVLWDEDDFRFHPSCDSDDLEQVRTYLRSDSCRKAGLFRYFATEQQIPWKETRCGACDYCARLV